MRPSLSCPRMHSESHPLSSPLGAKFWSPQILFHAVQKHLSALQVQSVTLISWRQVTSSTSTWSCCYRAPPASHPYLGGLSISPQDFLRGGHKEADVSDCQRQRSYKQREHEIIISCRMVNKTKLPFLSPRPASQELREGCRHGVQEPRRYPGDIPDVPGTQARADWRGD